MRPDNRTIKRELRKRFRTVRFSVRSGRGTAATWTHVSWTDGPSEAAVRDALAEIGAAPGHMDMTDYWDGEKIGVERTLSDAHRARMAARLLAPHPVPPPDAWSYDVRRQNCGGYYTLHTCIFDASTDRERFDRARFDALAWLDAYQRGSREAPSSVLIA